MNYGYMILFKLLELGYNKKLPLRNQLEILLQVYLVEKLNIIHTLLIANTGSNDCYQFNCLEIIMNHILQFIDINPKILIDLYLNYDLQLFSLPIFGNFIKALSALVII